MDAKTIYYALRSIVEPIHSYDDQMVAISKWIEAEFTYNPDRKIEKAAPELLEACKISLICQVSNRLIIQELLEKTIKSIQAAEGEEILNDELLKKAMDWGKSYLEKFGGI